jgi:hypothetical protein
MKGGEHKKMMKNASMLKRERSIKKIEKRNSSRFPLQLLFSGIGPFTLWNVTVSHDTAG